VIVYLVLDTTAILEYSMGSINVGEPITEVVDEGPDARFAVPTVCLMEAYRRVLSTPGEPGLAVLDVLARHPHALIVPTPVQQWKDIGRAAAQLGRLDRALAIHAAEANEATMLTVEADVYRAVSDGELPWFVVDCS
jgi:hypothetical protein